ncbi:MAG: DUF418 domain-containing protein [Planctomycetota bacterium]
MRLHQIDALRGFALLGILIVNIFVFHAPYAHYSAFYSRFAGLESQILEGMIFLFSGKFVFIYSFLFGYSFALQREKFDEDRAFRDNWTRRMAVLAFFGILHLVLLSFGDILLPYALLGLTLPFLARWSSWRLVVVALVVNLIPVYEFVLRGVFEYPDIAAQPAETLENSIRINRDGNYAEVLSLRLRDYFSLRNEKLIVYMPKEFSLFLVGIIAARNGLASKVNVPRATGFCLASLAATVGIFVYRTDLIAAFDYESSIRDRIALILIIHAAEFVHGMLYIVGFFLLWKLPAIRNALFCLTFTGRLSLTLYVMQSLICLILFSGFDLYARLTPSQLILAAIAIYVAQLVFALQWLHHRQQGPLESIWRRLSRRAQRRLPSGSEKSS